MLEKSIEHLATLGPIGKKCPAPGTFGSLAGLLSVLILSWLTELPLFIIGLSFVPFIFLGIPLCTQAEKSLGCNDPGEVIWDEFTSIPLVFIGLPNSISLANPKEMLIWLAVGFIYFRIFDIFKPLGIKKVQHSGRGFGIMIDDGLAAVYSAGLLYLTFTFSLSFF